MVEAGVGGDVVEGSRGSGLGVGSGVDQARDAGGVGGSGAHRAGFERGVERAAGEPPGAEGFGGAAEREYLGVGRGVGRRFTLVGGYGENLPVLGNQRADGYLSSRCRFGGGAKGAAHEIRVCFIDATVFKLFEHNPIIATRKTWSVLQERVLEIARGVVLGGGAGIRKNLGVPGKNGARGR